MSHSVWYRPGEAAKVLGCGENKLYECRKSGEFKLGVHYQDRRQKLSRRSSFYYNVPAILEYWSKVSYNR